MIVLVFCVFLLLACAPPEVKDNSQEEIDKILEQEDRSFEVEGKDDVGLLYNFLEEFLFLLDAEDFLVAGIKSIDIEGNKLKCVVVGDAAKNYKFTNDVKAVTYSDMFVKKEDNKFVCEVVLDV